MAEPTVHPFTRRIYDELPEFYRDADLDDGTPNGRPLLRFVSLIGDQLGDVEDLVDRLDPAPRGGSQLHDAQRAGAAWLPVQAPLLGVAFLPPGLPVADQRNIIGGAVSGWRAGTRQALTDAARSALTDPAGYVSVRPHSGGDPFVIGVSVDPEFAPADLNDVIAAIEDARARPAGILLVIDLYAASWATLETVRNTWAGFDAVNTWARLEGTDPA